MTFLTDSQVINNIKPGQILRFNYNNKLRLVKVETVGYNYFGGFDKIGRVYRTFNNSKVSNLTRR